jgi:hypothetical protein
MPVNNTFTILFKRICRANTDTWGILTFSAGEPEDCQFPDSFETNRIGGIRKIAFRKSNNRVFSHSCTKFYHIQQNPLSHLT